MKVINLMNYERFLKPGQVFAQVELEMFTDVPKLIND